MTAAERQNAIVERINGFGDCFEQYSYLILLSGQLPAMPGELKTEENRVEGCQSVVWVSTRRRDGRLRVFADSDTLILRGVLSLIAEIADGAPCGELAELELDLLDRTDLGLVFRSERLTGIGHIWRRIRDAARSDS